MGRPVTTSPDARPRWGHANQHGPGTTIAPGGRSHQVVELLEQGRAARRSRTVARPRVREAIRRPGTKRRESSTDW